MYVTALLNSSLFRWYLLITSGKFGVERDSILKLDVDDMPLRPLSAEVTQEKLSMLLNLDDELEQRTAIDEFLAPLYEISPLDLSTIQDTLAIGLPYREERLKAQTPPSDDEIAAFMAVLQQTFDELLSVSERHVQLQLQCGEGANDPWAVLTVEAEENGEIDRPIDLRRFADAIGASQIVYVDDGCLRIVLLRQGRYWTRTRARMLARRLVAEHAEVFLGAQ